MTTESCNSPDDTFGLGETIGRGLTGGEILLLYGGLGAGKTLLTKGIMSGLDYDIDEVTSPSFALVNLYKSESFDVYHIDLWRLDHSADPAGDVGLDEILTDPNAVTIIEWADRLPARPQGHKIIAIELKGDGDAPREISIKAEGQDDR